MAIRNPASRLPASASRLLGGFLTTLLLSQSLPAQTERLPFKVELKTIHQELRPNDCWFHPRAVAIPGRGQNQQPLVLLTLQKHLKVSDYYSGLYFMRSLDGGRTFDKPTLPPQLDWQKESDNVDIAVCDVTPGWHAPTGRALAIGIKLRYSKKGEHLLDKPRSHECAYAVYDPARNAWTGWKMLQMPYTDDKFFLVAPGCVQWLVKDDGTLLIPMYFRNPVREQYTTTILHCRFSGEKLEYIAHGDELALADVRGLCEPSLTKYRNRYYLTIRNDLKGYVTTSDDGLHFAPIKPWKFDDDSDLGSYNTQQHWLTHSDGLFLAYTRRGANNDHIPRNRAPLFLAQVDPENLKVLRDTEQVLIPERGAMLGNFGANPISPHESWVTDAEFYLGDKPHAKGADNSIFAARVLWSRPNKLIPFAP